MGSVVCGTWAFSLRHMSSVVVACRLSCPVACGILVPQSGIEPTSPALEWGFFTTGPPGRSQDNFYMHWETNYSWDCFIPIFTLLWWSGTEPEYFRSMPILPQLWFIFLPCNPDGKFCLFPGFQANLLIHSIYEYRRLSWKAAGHTANPLTSLGVSLALFSPLWLLGHVVSLFCSFLV